LSTLSIASAATYPAATRSNASESGRSPAMRGRMTAAASAGTSTLARPRASSRFATRSAAALWLWAATSRTLASSAIAVTISAPRAIQRRTGVGCARAGVHDAQDATTIQDANRRWARSGIAALRRNGRATPRCHRPVSSVD
jgi:hypothetical protein